MKKLFRNKNHKKRPTEDFWKLVNKLGFVLRNKQTKKFFIEIGEDKK